ncbi:MAG: glycosyltransferase [Thioalkalispiraceae bacterium]|jgi:glycosyltransferase involved in cell wall biosynthesis
MKILHVVENLNIGGLERLVVNLVKQHKSEGHDLMVVCLFSKGDLANELETMDVNVVACNKNVGVDFFFVKKLRRTIVQYKPDIIHTHNAMSHYYSVLATLLLSNKIINTRHGMGLNPYSRKREILYKLTWPLTAHYVAVAKFAHAGYLSRKVFPPNKSSVVYNSIDIESITRKNDDSKKSFTNKYNIPKESFIYGMVSRFSNVKDHRTLVYAFKKIANSFSNAVLVLIGDGEEFNNIKNLIDNLQLENNVLMLGERQGASKYLQYFDVFILSTKTEGYSMALLEASAAGLPLIATNVGGNSEIITSNYNGYLVKQNDPDDLAQAMRCVVDDADNLNRISLNSFEWANNNATLTKCASEYMKIYKQII